MSCSYEIDKDNNILILHYYEEFVVDDLLSLRNTVVNDPAFKPDMLVIDDVSGITTTNVSSEQLAELAGQSIMRKKVKRAIVAINKFQHGLTRLYMAHAEYAGYDFQLFDSIEKAKAWMLSGSPIDDL